MSKRSIVVFALTLTLSAAQMFEWFAESPKNCARDPTQCCGSACEGDRDVYCRVRGTNAPISPLFCADTPNPFSSRVNCDENECRRDCVVSEWSPWGACSATCGNLATEYRSRRVLVPPEAGRSCPDLSQTRTCRNATLRLPCPAPPTPSPTAPIYYLWRLGPWSACQSVGGNRSDCGPGSIFRVVNCVASNGTVVGDNNCKANPRETSPINRQACNLPCNCQVDQWSSWSNCSAQCYTKSNSSSSSDSDLPYHERTRTVIRTSQSGGTPCPALFARQSCDVDSLPDCPRYQWHNASWFDCDLDVAGDVCGFGTQKRTVFCVLENDPTNTPADDRFCTGEFLPPGAVKTAAPVRPLTTRPCQILCPQDCVTGAWSEWGQCSRSCGEGGVRRRTRPVLVPSLNGGAPCGDLNQTAPCESINCTFWSIGRYSACVPNDFIKRCGPGIRLRHISCLNALNQILSNDSMCPGSKPIERDNCYLPCDGDCVLTEWSQWTGCPGTCGGAGIVQKRTRSILLYNETSGRQCVDDDQLIQRKPCNVFVPCITYVWRHEKWANCIYNSSLDDEGTGSGSGDNESSSSATKCGPSIGVQDRNVYCEQQFSGFGRRRVSDATCFDPNNVVEGDSVKPATVQQCDIDCPVDCEVSPWSDWSACSATCGSATRLRSRFVTKAAAFGGASCPPNRDGIVTDTSSCDDVPPCYAYAWSTTAWSECQLIRLPNVDVSSTCGPGFRTRDVTCRRDGDNQTVADGVCSAGLLTARPGDVLNCNIPCEDECEFGAWTAFSDCSLTCGGGSKSRTRSVLFKNSTLSAAERNQTCPHIKADQLIERDPCNDFPCLEYGWVASEWLTCIPSNDVDSCGDGIQERHVNCETLTDHVFVSLQLCFSVGVAPNRTRSCHVPCPVDCVVGNWSAWSVCNGSCDSHGLGYETRTRDMLVAPADGGRPCFELEQRRPCLSDCEWDIGAWGECVLDDGSLSCGDGRRNRSVTCLVNGVLVNDNRCFVLGDKPSLIDRRPGKPISDEACRTPCPNDCVVTEWSEWSNCIPTLQPVEDVCRNSPGSAADFLGQHSRQRSILRASSNCPSTLGEDQFCRPAACQTFRWHVTAWGNCVMSGGGDCGGGTQQRQIVCASDWDPRIRDAAACSGTPAPTPTSRQCSVPCPADCDVDTWAPWTCTNGSCGGAGRRERSRAVIIAPNERGRQCPILLQKERCAFDPCFSYAYERGPWGNCSVGLNSARCGVGIRERSVICRQSDGLSVPLECCIIKKCPSRTDSSNLINVDYRALNIHSQDVCGIACPGDCVLAPWSNWGPCSLDCSSGSGRGMRSRSRGIIVAASLGGLCPDQTSRIETEQCSANVQCFLYAWVTTPWANGVRNVSCVRTVQGGGGAVAVVDSGCVEALRPAAQQSCVSDTCDGAGQVCNTTAYRCQCRDGYFEARDECVPMSGCTDNRHCPLFHTACVGGECRCDPSVGAVQGENGACIPPSTSPPTTASLRTEPATTQDGFFTAELSGGTDDIPYWAWIIIALGILILVAVVLCIVFCHQRHKESFTFSPSQEYDPMDRLQPRSSDRSPDPVDRPWLEEPRPVSAVSDSSIRKPPLVTANAMATTASDDDYKRGFDSYPSTLEKDTKF